MTVIMLLTKYSDHWNKHAIFIHLVRTDNLCIYQINNLLVTLKNYMEYVLIHFLRFLAKLKNCLTSYFLYISFEIPSYSEECIEDIKVGAALLPC